MNIFDQNQTRSDSQQRIADAWAKKSETNKYGTGGPSYMDPRQKQEAAVADQRAASLNQPFTYGLSGSSGVQHGVDPQMRLKARADAARQALMDQYNQQMNAANLQNTQGQATSNWNTEQMLNQRLAGANPGAQSPGGVAGAWGDSRAQQMLSYYLMKNLGTQVPTMSGQAFQGMQKATQGNPSPLGFGAQQSISRLSPQMQQLFQGYMKNSGMSSANSQGG